MERSPEQEDFLIEKDASYILYLMSKQRNFDEIYQMKIDPFVDVISCAECGSDSTPQWRKGWDSYFLRHKVFLCNACGLRFNHKRYCTYCFEFFPKIKNGDKITKDRSCPQCNKKYKNID